MSIEQCESEKVAFDKNWIYILYSRGISDMLI